VGEQAFSSGSSMIEWPDLSDRKAYLIIGSVRVMDLGIAVKFGSGMGWDGMGMGFGLEWNDGRNYGIWYSGQVRVGSIGRERGSEASLLACG